MGWGRVPASPQRAARGCPKSALLQPEPACPGAWAAAGPHRRAKGQGSALLLLVLPPAAKGNRARAPQWAGSRRLPCPACKCDAERCVAAGQAGSRQLEPGPWLSGSGSEPPESQRATGRDSPAQPSACPPTSCGQQQSPRVPTEPRPAAAAQRVSLLLQDASSLGLTSLHGDTQETVRTEQPAAGGCLSFQNSPGEQQSPSPLLDGTTSGPCLGSACKNRAALREQARSRKGHRRAASRHQQPERGASGALCLAGPPAPHSRFPHSAASEDHPGAPGASPTLSALRVAPPHPPSLSPCLPACLPHKLSTLAAHPWHPAQPELAERQPFSPLPGAPSASPGSWC